MVNENVSCVALQATHMSICKRKCNESSTKGINTALKHEFATTGSLFHLFLVMAEEGINQIM